MCIYKKVVELRKDFHKAKLEKNGKGYGYVYFDLGDFLPIAMKLCSEHGVFTQVSFMEDHAKMDVVDIANPESKYEILTPMSTANLKGCHPVQNLGAVQTYIRRYLWMAFLEVVEHDGSIENDALEDDEPENKIPETKAEKKITAPPVKKEDKKIPKPKADSPAPANYNIHFMNQIAKTGKMKDIMEMIPKIYSKKAADMTVSEKKVVLAALMADFPEAGITTD